MSGESLSAGGADFGGADFGESAAAVVTLSGVVDSPIFVESCVAAVENDHAGAVVTFAGVVRDHDEGKGVR
jgi:molybdopterin synthase catalytic subunit